MTLAKQLLSQNPYLNYVRCAHSLTRKPVGVPALLSPLEETPAFPYPLDLLRYAMARAHWTEDGSAAEFGVYQGASLRYIANQVPGVTVYGFDSFRGLPKAWNGFPAGTFATKVPPITKNTRLVIGWYNETLPYFVAEM